MDFGPIVRGIAVANPDIVYVGSYPLDTAGIGTTVRPQPTTMKTNSPPSIGRL